MSTGAGGGGGYGDGKLPQCLCPFGNNIYFSYQLYLTPSNLVAVTPNVSFTPFRNARVSAEYDLAWRDNAMMRSIAPMASPLPARRTAGRARLPMCARADRGTPRRA
jgi:hypothetical protein